METLDNFEYEEPHSPAVIEDGLLSEFASLEVAQETVVTTEFPNMESSQASQSNTDEQMRELLSKLRNKYCGSARNVDCFPENPKRKDYSDADEFASNNLESRTGQVDWCKCGACVAMPTNLESICCVEIENASPYMENRTCLCEHEIFNFLCTREETVNIILRTIGEFRHPPAQKDANRLHRKTAYRGFTAWIHGYLGIGNRRPIPSCVVKKVRSAFPDPQGQYVGFRPVADSAAEFMAYE